LFCAYYLPLHAYIKASLHPRSKSPYPFSCPILFSSFFALTTRNSVSSWFLHCKSIINTHNVSLIPAHTLLIMNMSYSYNTPSSPSYGFFPAGATSPNAFAGLHQSPREQHAMYAALSASTGYSQPHNGQQTQSQGGFKKYVTRK
jgi:hypothetical protein